MTCNSLRHVFLTAGLLACCTIPDFASVGLPVHFSLGSADSLRRGEPITILVAVQSGADLPFVKFEVGSSTDWQVLDGTSHWAGAVGKGQTLQFQFRAIALTDQPEELAATLSVPGEPARIASLDPNRLGGRFPERVKGDPEGKAGERASEEERSRGEYDPSGILAVPLAATEPQIPGQEPTAARGRAPAASKTRDMRGASFTATGRFTYLDDNNVRRGVRNATVELWNLRSGNDLLEDKCDTGITDGNGNFSLNTTCSDLFDGPDLAVRIVLNTSVAEVKPDSIFAGSYTFQSGTRTNVSSDSINFGTITITSNRGAFQAHNLVTRAHTLMSQQGENLSKVTVLWPSASSSPVSFYTPILANLTLKATEPFGDEGTVFHEYGHHILSTVAESPSPDYSNGNCDSPGHPGHCLDQPEKGAIAWTEGWPDFFGAFLYSRHETVDGYGANTRYRFENHPANFAFPGEEDHTEAFVAALLWDLTDGVDDDEDEQGAGRRDRINLTFQNVWDVIKNFDPSADLFHNHPTSVHELWTGLRLNHRGDINRISEAYREHNIIKPQPDLEMTAVQTAPTQIPRGASFTISNTVRNTGNELANNGFTVRLRLVPVVGPGNFALPVTVGSRTIGVNMAAGGSNTATTTLTVPATATAGNYVLQACADSGGAVPESVENNNCRTAAGSVVVQ